MIMAMFAIKLQCYTKTMKTGAEMSLVHCVVLFGLLHGLCDAQGIIEYMCI